MRQLLHHLLRHRIHPPLYCGVHAVLIYPGAPQYLLVLLIVRSPPSTGTSVAFERQKLRSALDLGALSLRLDCARWSGESVVRETR